MLLNSHILAYTRCLAEQVCGLVRSTWGTSQGEDKLGARGNAMHAVRTQCARSAKFWMSANTRTLVLAPFHKFLVPYQGFFGFPSI